MNEYIDADDVRTMFSKAMSDMYRSEVPLYGDLLELVHDVNAETLRRNPSLRANLEQRQELGKRPSLLACARQPTSFNRFRSTLTNSDLHYALPARLGLERHGAIRVGTANEVRDWWGTKKCVPAKPSRSSLSCAASSPL